MVTTATNRAHPLVPILMLAASAAFPVGASPQAAPPSTESSSLSAAMAEARRSRFYTTSSVDGLSIVDMASVHVPHVGDRLDRDSGQWTVLPQGFLADTRSRLPVGVRVSVRRFGRRIRPGRGCVRYGDPSGGTTGGCKGYGSSIRPWHARFGSGSRPRLRPLPHGDRVGAGRLHRLLVHSHYPCPPYHRHQQVVATSLQG